MAQLYSCIRKIIYCLLLLGIHSIGLAQQVTSKNGQYGLIGRALETLLEPVYDTVFPIILYGYKSSNLYQYKLNGKWGIYNYNNKKDTGPVIDEITDGKFGTIAYSTESKWGYAINTAPDYYELTVPKYDEVSSYIATDNYHSKVARNGKNYEGVNVRLGSKYGYSSYFADTLIVPIKYNTYVRHYGGADYFFVQEKNSNSKIIINPETGIDFTVQEGILLKQYGDFFCDHHFIGTKEVIDVWNFETGKQIFRYESMSEHSIHVRQLDYYLLEFTQAVDGKTKSAKFNYYTWLNAKNSTTVLRKQVHQCQQITIGGGDNEKGYLVYIKSGGCFLRFGKTIGRYRNGKIEKE
jgi:hypothetical protein